MLSLASGPHAATGCYFDNPQFYDRDRDLFRKYLPLIQKIARAGWEPLAMAWSPTQDAEIERFGPGKDGSLCFTVRSKDSSTAVLMLDPKLGKPKSAVKLPANQALRITESRMEVPLDSAEVAVVELSQ